MTFLLHTELCHVRASFTGTIYVTVFISGIFDLFNDRYKQHHRTALNPYINGSKTVTLAVRVNKAITSQWLSMTSSNSRDGKLLLGRVLRVFSLPPLTLSLNENDRWSVRTTHPPSGFFRTICISYRSIT